MTQVVTVHTDFTDLNQMAQGLVGRVNETHVILPGPDPVDVGEWVQFAVTLYDGTPGFAGVGRCVTVVDNGDERLAHQRFDVVIDSLQFDSRGQQIFEHILTLNGLGGAAEVGADEVADADGYAYADGAEPVEDSNSFEDVSSEFTGSKLELSAETLAVAEAVEAEQAYGSEEEEATMIGDSAGLADAMEREQAQEQEEEPDPFGSMLDDPEPAPTAPPPAPAVARSSFSDPPTAQNLGVLAAVAAPSVAPPAPAPSTPQRVNGVSFKYANGLPFPQVPPRPELDAGQRVSPAPRPTRD